MPLDITSWPATLQLDNSHNDALVCEKPLRNLPGKRLVCSGHWQQKAVIAKLFLDRRNAKRHYQREKTGVLALQAAKITTPTLLFAGQLNDQTPVLIFEHLPAPQTALHIWQDMTNDNQRLDFLRQILGELAAHHQAGLRQQDLHLDNFLYSEQHWYTIDGDGVDSRGAGNPLKLKDSLTNLALFFAQIPPNFDHLIEAALTKYSKTRQLKADLLHTSLMSLLFKVRRTRRLNYVKKSYRSCSEFVRQNTIHQVAIYRRDADPERIHQLLANPDALIAQGETLKNGNSATVARIFHPQENWVIKRYNIKNIWHALKRCLRPSRAWVSWGNTQRLNISNIATPQAIAVIEKRFGPLRLTSYYVCKHVDAPDATEYFSAQPTSNMETAQQFVTLFSLLKQLGIYHGDCKGTNFLIRDGQPWVIDLDSMREFCRHRHFLRAYPIDRKRFLRNWNNQPQRQQWFDEHLPR